MEPSLSFFSDFNINDFWFLGQAAVRTLWISLLSISLGTVLGIFFGWALYEGKLAATLTLAPLLDVFRSVPLIIQLVLFYNFAPIMGLNLDPFGSGVVILTIYTSALVANVARGGIEAVGKPLRNAARSLGISYWQDLRYIVFPDWWASRFSSLGWGCTWCDEGQRPRICTGLCGIIKSQSDSHYSNSRTVLDSNCRGCVLFRAFISYFALCREP